MSISSGVIIGPGARIKDAIILDKAEIKVKMALFWLLHLQQPKEKFYCQQCSTAYMQLCITQLFLCLLCSN